MIDKLAEIKLLPCPFCGISHLVKMTERTVVENEAWVWCGACDASGKICVDHAGKTASQWAAEFWNTRVQQEQSSAGQEKGAGGQITDDEKIIRHAIADAKEFLKLNHSIALEKVVVNTQLDFAIEALDHMVSPVVNQAEREGVYSRIGSNFGHGHAWSRPDGMRARCGGPGLCNECSRDFAFVQLLTGRTPINGDE